MPTQSLNLTLSTKPDAETAMKRVEAWYVQELLDRPPIQFFGISSCPPQHKCDHRPWKDRWFSAEEILDNFERQLEVMSFQGETFPIFWPNLGPVVYAGFYGTVLIYEETTVWAQHLRDWESIERLTFASNNECFRQIEKMTQMAIERCSKRYWVGYTDLHPGLDCVAAWRNSERLCLDLYDNPECVKNAAMLSVKNWHSIFDHFDTMLKQHTQVSVTWMGIPAFGKLHIPSCDFSAMISSEQFVEFAIPIILEEMKGMTRNIFHLDGPGVARHLNLLLELPQINAIQWVPGAGAGEPIMQWIPLLRQIQQASKSMVVTLTKEELPEFMEAMSPKGIFLCIYSTDHEEQREILKTVSMWNSFR